MTPRARACSRARRQLTPADRYWACAQIGAVLMPMSTMLLPPAIKTTLHTAHVSLLIFAASSVSHVQQAGLWPIRPLASGPWPARLRRQLSSTPPPAGDPRWMPLPRRQSELHRRMRRSGRVRKPGVAAAVGVRRGAGREPRAGRQRPLPHHVLVGHHRARGIFF